MCNAPPPHSRPRPILPVAKRVRDSGSSERMSQNAGPSVPSSLTPIRCTTAGTSVVPLEPLARCREVWLVLPSPSRWLTLTIRLGYAIQFARRPPKFSGVLETAVAAPVLHKEIAILLARMQSSRSLQLRCGRGFTALILQPIFTLPVPPCLHEGRGGRPCPVTGSGHQDPQLSVVRSQGPGASAPQPVGASGQLGKEQALPCAENLFSWCGVRREYDGALHGRARPISAELPEFLQRQGCGSAETVSEAPGAYGIRSCSHATRIASYETTSALVALPSPEMGMASRYTSGEHHTRLDGASTALAHQLPRAAGSASGLAAVSATAARQACVGPYGQLCGCVVHQPDGRYMITPHVTASPPSPPLESHAAQITAHCPHSGGAQSCGRCALTTAHFPGEWRLHPETIRLIWSRCGEAQVVLFASREFSHCQLYFSLTEGPLGTDALAHSWPRALCKYTFPPVSLLAQTLCKVREDEEQVLLVVPFWPTRTWFPELILLATAPLWRIPLRKDLLSQGLGTIWHPCPDLWNLHVWLLDGTRQT